MVAMAFIQQYTEYLCTKHSSRNWGYILFFLLVFPDKAECQMVIGTVKKIKHNKSDMIGNDKGKSRWLFSFALWLGNSEGLTLEPRLNDRNLALQRTGDRIPGTGYSKHRGMATRKSLDYRNREKAMWMIESNNGETGKSWSFVGSRKQSHFYSKWDYSAVGRYGRVLSRRVAGPTIYKQPLIIN